MSQMKSLYRRVCAAIERWVTAVLQWAIWVMR